MNEMLSQLLHVALSPSGLSTLVSVGLGALAVVLGVGATAEVRRRRVALATYHAFHVVEDLAAETQGEDGFDKVAEGLEVANAYMVAHGWRTLKPGEEDVARLGFKSLHGAQRVAAKEATLPF